MISRVAFIGSKSLGLSVLSRMFEIVSASVQVVLTLDDSKDERSNLNEYRIFCKSKQVPLEILSKRDQLAVYIHGYQPQLCLVAGWYWIIEKELLQSVPSGWLGFHASLLPAYRGGSPLVWAIINGEEKSGISLFYLEDGIDNGNIVAQREFPITKNDTIKEVLDKATASALEIVTEVYKRLLLGTAPRRSQNDLLATYVPMRKPADGRINWQWSNERIYNFIRAQTHPYPGAFCVLPDHKTLKIWNAGLLDDRPVGTPGTVFRVANGHLSVICGDGTALSLNEFDLVGGSNISGLETGRMLQLS
jgi:methionyl-tRNA formyltransferase